MKFKGFTLVEVMVTAVITSLVLMGMSTALIIGTRTSQNSITNTLLTTNGSRFVSRMINDILENADLKVENITQGRADLVIGEKFIIKNRDNQEAVAYKLYYNTAGDKKNKIYRSVNGGADQEMVIINPAGQTIELVKPTTGSGYVFNSGNGYQADIVLTLVCKQGEKELGRKVIKSAGITCRNFKKA